MRTSVYVDGFNLYYGALKGTAFKWVDLLALCNNTLQKHHEVQQIRYFTALIKPRPSNPQAAVRQQAFIRATETLGCVSVHYGSFLSHAGSRPLAPPGVGTAKVMLTQEKGSDVNLATYLLLDAFDDKFESAVVVSNDSDLATPIKIVRERFGKSVGVLNPHKIPAYELKKVARFQVTITARQLASSQLPAVIHTPPKGSVHKPARW